MRWVTFPGSVWTHAVFRGETQTACGRSLVGASIARLGVDHRCGDCDLEWRDRGVEAKPKKKPAPGEYKPRNTVEWEKES
jgi:hypothetical protein